MSKLDIWVNNAGAYPSVTFLARVALFCVSDMAMFMTGSVLLVDGEALMMAQGRYLPPAPGPIQTMYEVIELIDVFARNNNCPTPLFSLAARYYEQAMAEGRGEQDIAAIYALLGREAGLDLNC